MGCYPDDGNIVDYSSTISSEPGGCLQLALTANGIKDIKILLIKSSFYSAIDKLTFFIKLC